MRCVLLIRRHAPPLLEDMRGAGIAGQGFLKKLRSGGREIHRPPSAQAKRDAVREGLPSDAPFFRPVGTSSPLIHPAGTFSPAGRRGAVRAAAEPASLRGTVTSPSERVGGERGVAEERLGLALAQAPDGHERLDGHVAGLLLPTLGPQPLEGAIAIAPGLVEPAQVMAGQGQQEAVEGRGVRAAPRPAPGRRRPMPSRRGGSRPPRVASGRSARVGLEPRQARLGMTGTAGP